MVSQTPGGEYDTKMGIYATLGVLYHVIYNPDYWQRDRHQPFEVYKLINGSYQLQIGEPFWMSEIGLGIGRFQRKVSGIQLELLYWYDQNGNRYLAADEREQQANQQLEMERQKAERLAARLRELGEDPDRL